MAKPVNTVNKNEKPLKGEHLSRSRLGITYPKSLLSHVEMDRQEYLFVNLYNKKPWMNELHYDGVVHEPDDYGSLAEYGKIETSHKGRKIMVRYNPNADFEYVDDEAYMIRYDHKRNKIFFVEAKKADDAKRAALKAKPKKGSAGKK